MNLNSSRDLARAWGALQFHHASSVIILAGLVSLVLSEQLFASMGRPVFQGAADPMPPALTDPVNLTMGFNINLLFFNTPTAGELAAFTAAEAQWESVIKGYQIDDIFSTTVNIRVFLNPIDGVNGILGSAGPTHAKLNAAQNAVTSTFLYTQQGDMEFDTADSAALVTAGLFDDVVLHEMGHVLGVGTLWSSAAVGFPGRQESYVFGSGQYTGPAGLAAYNDEFSQSGTFVPVELGGGAGTANAHWDEINNGAGLTGRTSNIEPGPFNDMRYELMTGWLNAPLFMSSLTVQSMVDLGYVVIPEPSTMLLASLGLLGLVRRSPR